MAALAFVFLALIPADEMDAKVFWIFTEPACTACVDAQIAVMKRWARPQDVIVIQGNPGEAGGVLSQKIQNNFPNNPIKKPAHDKLRMVSTGWLWVDPSTGEEVSYNMTSGFYNSLWSKDLLRMLRD